jgi:hypothetical protein
MSDCLEVIVPCYKPPAHWEAAMTQRFLIFSQMVAPVFARTRLTIVIDGAAENAGETAISALKTALPDSRILFFEQNTGKGFALRQGVSAADAGFYLVTDMDFPYTSESMCQVAADLREKGGIIAGRRAQEYYVHTPASRRWLSKTFRWVLRHILRQPVDDSQCGLKAFDDAGKVVFLRTRINRFLYDLEFLMLANGQVPVHQTPVVLRPDIVFSKVNFRILIQESFNFLRLWIKSSK